MKTEISRPQTPSPNSYSEILFGKLRKEHAADFLENESLVKLNYQEEIDLKNTALKDFWNLEKLPSKPADIILSPKSRKYRTNSKRRAFLSRHVISLGFTGEGSRKKFRSFSPTLPELEPEEHLYIYRFLEEKLNERSNSVIARNLNYIIIRGSYQEFSVIFNVFMLNAEIVRKLKHLAECLRELPLNIVSSHILHSPAKSEYYFDNNAPSVNIPLKKLFGPDKNALMINSEKYMYHIMAFSQVNESILPSFLAKIRELLKPGGDERLFDLYCGYGIFSLYLRDSYNQIYGMDYSKFSISSAIDNLRHLKTAKSNIRFLSEDVSEKNLEKLWDKIPHDMPEAVILDPPRNGTGLAVIEAISERGPEKVLHICCGIEKVPGTVRDWRDKGYRLKTAAPFDMFPGTANLETLLFFEKN